MNFHIIIPAHNEQNYIGKALESLTQQTLLPKAVVVVNDNSTDNTQNISEGYASKYPWISVINSKSSDKHLPGSKIIQAFNKGLAILNDDYDIICKFDADLIFPKNYLEKIAYHFQANKKLGMASGFCYIEKNNEWILENLTNNLFM